jgi:hypothetical protein
MVEESKISAFQVVAIMWRERAIRVNAHTEINNNNSNNSMNSYLFVCYIERTSVGNTECYVMLVSVH